MTYDADIDDQLVLRDEMFAEMAQLAQKLLSMSILRGPHATDGTPEQIRYTLLHDALRQCTDLAVLKQLVGMDFYTREPAPSNTDDLNWRAVGEDHQREDHLVRFHTALVAAAAKDSEPLIQRYSLEAEFDVSLDPYSNEQLRGIAAFLEDLVRSPSCPVCGVGFEGPDLAGNQGHLFTCSKHPDHK